MTIVSVASDLHLEFGDLTLPGGGILIGPGDWLVASRLDPFKNDADSRSQRKRYKRFACEELSKYEYVLYTPGNHDFYGGVYEDTFKRLRDFFAEFAPNTRLLHNEHVEIDGVRFIASTLWATYGFGTANQMAIQDSMNDFKLIHVPCESDKSGFKTRKFRVEDANRLHQEAIAFLKEAVNTEMPCIVMTHHAPTYLACNRKRFPDGRFDDAYASNLHGLIMDNPHVRMAFHGHSHYRYRANIGETKVAANPRGYYSYERESRSFDAEACDFSLETFEFL